MKRKLGFFAFLSLTLSFIGAGVFNNGSENVTQVKAEDEEPLTFVDTLTTDDFQYPTSSYPQNNNIKIVDHYETYTTYRFSGMNINSGQVNINKEGSFGENPIGILITSAPGYLKNVEITYTGYQKDFTLTIVGRKNSMIAVPSELYAVESGLDELATITKNSLSAEITDYSYRYYGIRIDSGVKFNSITFTYQIRPEEDYMLFYREDNEPIEEEVNSFVLPLNSIIDDFCIVYGGPSKDKGEGLKVVSQNPYCVNVDENQSLHFVGGGLCEVDISFGNDVLDLVFDVVEDGIDQILGKYHQDGPIEQSWELVTTSISDRDIICIASGDSYMDFNAHFGEYYIVDQESAAKFIVFENDEGVFQLAMQGGNLTIDEDVLSYMWGNSLWTVTFEGNNAVISSQYQDDTIAYLAYDPVNECFIDTTEKPTGDSCIQIYRLTGEENLLITLDDTDEGWHNDSLYLAHQICMELGDEVCSADGSTNFNVLLEKWNYIFGNENKYYTQLTTVGHEMFTYAAADEEGDAYQQAVAKYDYIMSKYGEAQLADVFNRHEGAGSSSRGTLLNLEDDSSVELVIIITTMASLSLIGVVVLKKKKEIK